MNNVQETNFLSATVIQVILSNFVDIRNDMGSRYDYLDFM